MTRLTVRITLAALALALVTVATTRAAQRRSRFNPNAAVQGAMPTRAVATTRPADNAPLPSPRSASAGPSASSGNVALAHAAPGRDLTGSYRVLLEQSIFSKDRARTRTFERPRAEAAPTSQPTRPPFRPEARYALRGTAVVTEGVYLALLEDTETRQNRRVLAGQSFAGGRVTEVSLNGLRFRPGMGQETEVNVGTNLAGQPAPAATPAPRGESPMASGSPQRRGRWGSRGPSGGDRADQDRENGPGARPGGTSPGGDPRQQAIAGGAPTGPGPEASPPGASPAAPVEGSAPDAAPPPPEFVPPVELVLPPFIEAGPPQIGPEPAAGGVEQPPVFE